MFDLFFDDRFYNFDRLVKDKYPYKIKQHNQQHLTLVHNVLGLGKDDISVTIDRDVQGNEYLVISGEATDETFNTNYKVNSRFNINSSQVEKIDCVVKNGLLYVDIYYNKPSEPSVPINII